MSEMKKRDGWIRRLCEKSAVIIVSSAEAARDMARFFPESAGRVRVLHFVARDAGACKISDVRSVKSRYGITGQYFIVANQFWAHKNHRLIIDALKRFSGPPGFIVVATGSALDYRDSGYFARLMDYAASSGVSDFLKVTGVVPYEDLRVLIEGSMALINPSRFEGWSTPLEEAKASGKKSLLSDIPVHREQCPERAVFFAPDDAEGLAACMRETALEFDEREERKSRELAYQGWLSARRVFAEQFEDIVLEAASANKSCPYGDHRR
jgi:glycosyltransferase involved in cell wall biosynthesis